MDAEVQLIHKFYQAFQKLDAVGMNACYHTEILFYDPVFGMLKGEHTMYMWEMLCKEAKDFSLVFGNIIAQGEGYYTCDWVASYTFSKTGRRVVNKVEAFMLISDDKIIEHSDGFSIHKWSMMAIGFTGWLLGWNSLYQNRIKRMAGRKLAHYILNRIPRQA